MRKKFIDKVDGSVIDKPLFKIVIQPPTFRTVQDAYAHFTRHLNDYVHEDDDIVVESDDVPDFIEQGIDSLDIIGNQNNYSSSSPFDSTKDGQRTEDEPDEAQATEGDSSSSSTSE